MARKSTPPKKDFIAYKGRMSLKITPQTPRGWRYLGAWMLGLLVLMIPFVVVAIAVDDTPNEHYILWAVGPSLLLTFGGIWVMTRWMLARSEVIDMDEIAQWKRDKARQKPQSKRGE